MWDIKVICDGYYTDIFKAYFIVNNLEYKAEKDGIVFYVDTVDKFFTIIDSLNKFYHEHKTQHMESFDFVVSVDEDNGAYCVTPMRYGEY